MIALKQEVLVISNYVREKWFRILPIKEKEVELIEDIVLSRIQYSKGLFDYEY
jgi:hypothetical protein